MWKGISKKRTSSRQDSYEVFDRCLLEKDLLNPLPRIKAPKIKRPKKPTDDLRLVAAEMDKREALLTYRYYRNLQRMEHRHKLQLSQLHLKNDSSILTQELARTIRQLKNQVGNALDIYADQHLTSRWVRDVGHFKGPIATGFHTLINIEKAPTASSLWRFAGLDPSTVWIWDNDAAWEVIEDIQEDFPYPDDTAVVEKLAKRINVPYETLLKRVHNNRTGEITWESLQKAIKWRPYSSELRYLCFLASLSFQNNIHQIDWAYTQLFRRRRDYEMKLNEAGAYADQAANCLKRHNWNPDGTPYWYYSRGFLPYMHIKRRARRWVVKVFLAHYHQVAYYERYSKLPPKPYILEVLDGNEIVCPGWPFK